MRSGAKRRDINFAWSFEDFVAFCSDTNYMALRGKKPGDYSIDRIDPDPLIGYTKHNVRILVNRLNFSARATPRTRGRWMDKQGKQSNKEAPGYCPF